MSVITNNYRVLVIDDMTSIHVDFKKILIFSSEKKYQCLDEINAAFLKKSPPRSTLPPFEIDFASQGQEGVSLVQKSKITNNPYAVTFVDVQMPPGEDGIDTIKKIWQLDNEIQTVICTAYAKYSWDDLKARFGENDRLFIIKKPFDTLEIMQMACSLTKKWNLNKVIHEELTKLKNLPWSAPLKVEAEASINSMKDAIQSLAAINTKFINKPKI